MAYERKVRQLKEYIRDLCARLARAEGDEFHQLAVEFRVAAELFDSTKDGGRNSQPAEQAL